MRDRIEYTVAAALAAVIVSSPITAGFYAIDYIIKLVSVL